MKSEQKNPPSMARLRSDRMPPNAAKMERQKSSFYNAHNEAMRRKNSSNMDMFSPSLAEARKKNAQKKQT